jgi:hypothetical protein
MQTNWLEQLEALRVEHARHREEWAEVRKGLAALGDRVLAVPRHLLERIDGACAPRLETIHHPVIRA